MRKFLVVSFTSEQKFTGGLQCSKRNLESIMEIYGRNNVLNYKITPYQGKQKLLTKIKRIRDIFHGFMGGLETNHIKKILNLIKTQNITDVFVDSALLGLLAKKIKISIPNVRVFTFCHNFEKGFTRDAVIGKKDYFHLYWILLTRINEGAAIKYSDRIICLNSRDADSIEKEYGRKPDCLIPITLKSTRDEFNKIAKSENKEALFLGSYFFGNIQGLKWFCEKVLPNVDIHLTIVGASMDRFVDDIVSMDKISIYSDVSDLKPFFDSADFVVLPIISGSGMKVKTAEALMYGKYILGTNEAFMGYEITESVGQYCDTAEQFINALNKLSLLTKFNQASRSLFEDKYSFESSLSSFKKVLE